LFKTSYASQQGRFAGPGLTEDTRNAMHRNFKVDIEFEFCV
jgi:hypothetical protein